MPETLPRVLADPALLERALANVVANAVAVLARRTSGRASRPAAVDGRVDLRVIDRGPGMPVADRASACSSRSSASATEPDGNGVGLGLAVAQASSRRWAARSTLDDTPGGGLTDRRSRLRGRPT